MKMLRKRVRDFRHTVTLGRLYRSDDNETSNVFIFTPSDETSAVPTRLQEYISCSHPCSTYTAEKAEAFAHTRISILVRLSTTGIFQREAVTLDDKFCDKSCRTRGDTTYRNGLVFDYCLQFIEKVSWITERCAFGERHSTVSTYCQHKNCWEPTSFKLWSSLQRNTSAVVQN